MYLWWLAFILSERIGQHAASDYRFGNTIFAQRDSPTSASRSRPRSMRRWAVESKRWNSRNEENSRFRDGIGYGE